jgi:small-conductance mechanosensitive channel
MKYLAVLLNLVSILLVGWLLFDNGFPSNERDAILIIFFGITPIVSLFVLLTNYSGDWLSLFLRRKALEEQIKIDLLNGK